MTTATISSSNGQQVRKTLASQLDRLDAILDSLSDGLNQAVASAVEQAVEAAVREGVRQGVRGALSEILSDPEVLAAIRATAAAQAADAQPAAAAPPAPSRGPGLLGRAWNRVKAAAHRAGSPLGAAARRVRQAAATACGWLCLLKPFRGRILLALSVGAAAGVGAYFAGPYVAAGAGWLAGVLSTVAVQAGIALRRLTAQANFS
jgi:hypothetical protein